MYINMKMIPPHFNRFHNMCGTIKKAKIKKDKRNRMNGLKQADVMKIPKSVKKCLSH